MIDTPVIVDTKAQHAAVIHLRIPRARIQAEMGPAMHEVMTTVASMGITPTGPMFSHHARMDPDTFDFEVGVPVAAPITATGRVKPGTLPALRIARTVYHGGFEGLGAAWGEFNSWVKTNGHSMADNLWESYVRGPESGPDASTWQTELNRPISF